MNRSIRLLALGLVIPSLASCSAMQTNTEAEQALAAAVNQLKQTSSFSYEGNLAMQTAGGALQTASAFEGVKRSGGDLYVKLSGPQAAGAAKAVPGQWVKISDTIGTKANTEAAWNPQSRLERLLAAQKTVRWESGAVEPGAKALVANVGSAEAKLLMKEEWKEQLAQMMTAEKQRIEAGGAQLSKERRDAWNREIDQAAQSMESRLTNEMANVDAARQYRLVVDKKSGLPRELTIDTRLQHSAGEAQQRASASAVSPTNGAPPAETGPEDRTVAQYGFKTFNQDIMLPQT